MSIPSWYQIEVVPLINLPLDRSPFFSYMSATPIPLGSLVEISFGRQNLFGIVFAAHAVTDRLPPPWMKRVGTILYSQYLTQHQLALARFIAEDTFTPLGICLKHFVVSHKKKQKRIVTVEPKKIPSPLPCLSSMEAKLVKQLSRKTNTEKLLFTPYTASVRNILLSYLKTKTSANKQVLFLVPELFLADWWYAEFETYFPEDKIALIHSQLQQSTLVTSWEKVRSGHATLILGTRQALFAPFKNVTTLLVTDEEDQTSYKQWEMSPRYTVRRLAHKFVELWQAELILFTPTPSLATQLSLREKKIQVLSLPKIIAKGKGKLINLRLEKKIDARGIISQELLLALHSTLKEKKKSLIITKQKGWSKFSICRHCRKVFRCPKCEKALTGDREGHFICFSCRYRTTLFPRCPSCHEMTFLSFGAGTDRVEHEIRNHFPKANILRFDTTIQQAQTRSDAIKIIRQGVYDILIGTSAIIKIPCLPKTDLIAMIDADSNLVFPDYQAEEKLIQDLERLRLLCGNEGYVYIQTFDPEQSVFTQALSQDYLESGKALLTDRLSLQYPPYTKFIKIECRAKTLLLSKKIADQLAKEFIILQTRKKIPFHLIPAHLPLSRHPKKFYQIFLRLPRSMIISSELAALLRKYSKDCIYDFDPLTLY